MRLEFDLDVGALYIKLSDAGIASTREAGDNAAVDLDAAGQVIGIEVLSVAHQWPLSEILARYDIPASEAEQIRAYFLPQGVTAVQRKTPTIGIAAPAPVKVPAAA